jgi:hypothetical protein
MVPRGLIDIEHCFGLVLIDVLVRFSTIYHASEHMVRPLVGSPPRKPQIDPGDPACGDDF